MCVCVACGCVQVDVDAYREQICYQDLLELKLQGVVNDDRNNKN